MTTKKRRQITSADRWESIQVQDTEHGSVLNVTKWGPFDKLAGTAQLIIGCATCCSNEKAKISLKDAHRIGRLLLRLKPPASLKARTVR